MNNREFFNVKNAQVVPVFVTTKELTVVSYAWECGYIPTLHPVEVVLPVGTELYGNGWTNYGDGYAMTAVHPNKTFKGLKKAQSRWVRVDFADIEYSHHRLDSSVKINIRVKG